MTTALLVDQVGNHAEQLGVVLAKRGLTVVRTADIEEAINKLRSSAHVWEIVILVIGDLSRPWLSILRNLQEAAQQRAFLEMPVFLCVSQRELGINFQLRIERMGARYASEE